MEGKIAAENGAFIFYYSYNIGSQWQNASKTYETINGAGIDLGYFCSGPLPSGVNPPFAGFSAVINLKTGEVMGKDSQGDYLDNTEIVNLVKEANQ